MQYVEKYIKSTARITGNCNCIRVKLYTSKRNDHEEQSLQVGHKRILRTVIKIMTLENSMTMKIEKINQKKNEKITPRCKMRTDKVRFNTSQVEPCSWFSNRRDILMKNNLNRKNFHLVGYKSK